MGVDNLETPQPPLPPRNPNRTRSESRDRAVGVVCSLVTYQRASVGRTVVGDGRGSILSHHANVKIHQPLPRDRWGSCAHPMGGVAYRTAKAVLRYVQAMIGEARTGG